MPPPSLPLGALLNKYRTEAVSDGAIATTCWFPRLPAEKDGAEWCTPLAPVSALWDEKTGTLLHVESADDFDSAELKLRMGLLNKSISFFFK